MSRKNEKDMRVAIYAKGLPGKSADAQNGELLRLCRRRGWSACSTYAVMPGRARARDRAGARLALVKDLLRRQYDVVAVWRIAMLGLAIDDLLWTLHEVHVVRGIHVMAPGDGIDTTRDDSLKKVLAALDRVERCGSRRGGMRHG